MTVSLKGISKENLDELLSLDVSEDQKAYVSSVSKFSHIIFAFSLPVCMTVVCNCFVNNGLSRLKISHTYGTMMLEKYLCKQFDKP